jgi:hypothetical protein
MNEQDGGEIEFSQGPNTACFSCGGFRKVSEPRVYVIQATPDLRTGMTMSEWRSCPQCGGSGQLHGLRPPL